MTKDNKKFHFPIFPNGKTKALTLSYDDGVVQDRRLVKLLNEYGVKCTFNLGAGVLGYEGSFAFNGGKEVDISKVQPEEVKELYAGHEVAGHSLWHSDLPGLGAPAAMYEIIEDRRQLEQLTGKLVRSFAYPFGTWNETVKNLLYLAGYRSARTVVSTGKFDIPKDFLTWDATCHHNDPKLMDYARDFCEGKSFFPKGKLFYLWGHAYEFDSDDNWNVIEEFVSYVSRFKDDIWFATNGEIVEYITAYQNLQYSADGCMVYNPSAIDVWIGSMGESFYVPAGQTVDTTPKAAK